MGALTTKTGVSKRTVCPFCSKDRTKKDEKVLSILGNKFFCHHCGKGGCIGNDGKYYLGSGKGMRLPLDQKEFLKGGLPETVLKWFRERGIQEATLKRNRIEFENGFIKFPYFWKGELVNIKYRSLTKQFKQEKDRERVFYGIDDIEGQEEIIVTEGEIDKLSFEECGYLNCVSVPDGAPTPNTKTYTSKFDFVDNCIDIFTNVNKIILAVDNDSPGMTLQRELIRRLDPVKCWRVSWPAGCKDANDVLCKLGKGSLIEVIESASLVPIAGVSEAEDFKNEIDIDYENGGILPGVSTGIRSLDQFYTIRCGQLTIVTGTPSHGKSSLLTAILVNLAKNEGWNFALFSPENNPTTHFIERIMALYIGKPFNKGNRERMTWDEKESARCWVSSRFKHITPSVEECFKISDILDKAKICIQRYGSKGMVVDPWNEIDHTRPAGLTETEHISKCLSKFRLFARVYDIHIWVVAHPKKLQKDKDGRYPIPTAYDISGSHHFYDKADNILCVHRDVQSGETKTEVIIQKIRFRDVGKPGVVELRFDVATGRYFDVSTSEKLME